MRRLQQTLADYLVIAISPALIMLLVGSLCFFLLEVFYGGAHSARLTFIMAMFVMGATLISRISMEEGIEYATLFGIPLGVLTGLALLKYVEIRGPMAGWGTAVNLGLLGLLWWCASKLVWDCTLIDENQDASGEGLLQVAGLDKENASDDDRNQPAIEDADAVTSHDPKTVGFWEAMIERRKRPHTPGVWVIYFSLAALPLFGIGQWFIPASDLASRRYAFGLLCIYVASALALLVTTSFLGLRRYLRQRRLEMPPAMAATWIAVGGILIAGVILLAAVLPRPSAEYAISELPFEIGSPGQPTISKFGTGRDGPRDDKQGTQPGPKDENAASQSQEGDAEKGAPGQKSESGKGGQSKSQSESGEEKSSDQGSQDTQKSEAGENKQSDAKSEGGNNEQSKKQGDQEQQTAEQRTADSSGNEQPSQDDQANTKKSQQVDEQNAETSESRSANQRSLIQPKLPTDLPGWITTALKWLIYIVVGIVLIYVAVRKLPALWAALMEFWRNLFGGAKPTAEQEQEEAKKAIAALPPFSSYADPFATGIAGRYTTEQLMRYTFEALEAWAREHGVGRSPEQTPHEFAAQIGDRYPAVARDARNLADLYSRLAYAGQRLPEKSNEQLRPLWANLRPMAAAIRT